MSKIKVLVDVVTDEVFVLHFQMGIFSSLIYIADRTHKFPSSFYIRQ